MTIVHLIRARPPTAPSTPIEPNLNKSIFPKGTLYQLSAQSQTSARFTFVHTFAPDFLAGKAGERALEQKWPTLDLKAYIRTLEQEEPRSDLGACMLQLPVGLEAQVFCRGLLVSASLARKVAETTVVSPFTICSSITRRRDRRECVQHRSPEA